MNKQHKPVIETMINSVALALTSYGVLTITGNQDNYIIGFTSIGFGILLEWIKYYGRDRIW